MAVVALFPELTLHPVPVERFRFRAASRRAVLDADDADGRRVRLVFDGVMGVRYVPAPACYWTPPQPAEADRRRVLEDTTPVWVAELHSYQRQHHEPPTADLRHFAVPVGDGTWEVLAHNCRLRREDG